MSKRRTYWLMAGLALLTLLAVGAVGLWVALEKPPSLEEEGVKVYDPSGLIVGRTMGLYGNKKTLTCSWVGCPGLSIPVRWPNGASAYICTTDTVPYRDGWQVLRHANASHPMPKGAWLVN